ncbi:MAG: hypothetical protein LBS27_03690, partial [Bifidobacteriaceae bacterium]|nr:hypothetical protein [Bifidobacteriaceae bacterium]
GVGAWLALDGGQEVVGGVASAAPVERAAGCLGSAAFTAAAAAGKTPALKSGRGGCGSRPAWAARGPNPSRRP